MVAARRLPTYGGSMTWCCCDTRCQHDSAETDRGVPMPTVPPTATIRTQILVPLRFADGYATTARVFTFDGLVDGREHLALGLGDRSGVHSPDVESGPTLVRPHSECLTGDVF